MLVTKAARNLRRLGRVCPNCRMLTPIFNTALSKNVQIRNVRAENVTEEMLRETVIQAFVQASGFLQEYEENVLHLGCINQKVVAAEYAVRGSVVIKSQELGAKLREKNHGLPFDEIISCNIGNPQAVGQKPLTFFRQVLACVDYPEVMEHKDVFPDDVIERAKYYLSQIKGGTGAYSASQGVEVVREEVAKFITERDGVPSIAKNIFLTTGASEGVKATLELMISKTTDSILVPIPQYPLYSATVTLIGGHLEGYYLNEKKKWGLDANELKRALESSRSEGNDPKAIVIINPGNPTGQCLSKSDMTDVIKFCHENRLVLMADEVYQTNIYDDSQEWHSFKKVKYEMDRQYHDVELISFHSASKGFLGECGRRGGYMELDSFDPEVQAQLLKLVSCRLSSNIAGQIVIGMMVNPPKEGEPSHALYKEEKEAILGGLKSRAKKLVPALNKLEGVTCNAVQGAMYAFPQLKMPKKACDEAQKRGVAPDLFYCMELLENTGIVVVPGSGFKQVEGTWHLRTTILPPDDKIDKIVDLMGKFHQGFMDQYR